MSKRLISIRIDEGLLKKIDELKAEHNKHLYRWYYLSTADVVEKALRAYFEALEKNTK